MVAITHPAALRPAARAPRAPRRLDAATYRRRRLAAAGLAAVLLAVVLVLSSLAGRAFAPAGSTAPATAPAARITYVVQPGDTLWSIAATLAGDPSVDLRPLVDELVAANGGAVLTVGEQLVLER